MKENTVSSNSNSNSNNKNIMFVNNKLATTKIWDKLTKVLLCVCCYCVQHNFRDYNNSTTDNMQTHKFKSAQAINRLTLKSLRIFSKIFWYLVTWQYQ